MRASRPCSSSMLREPQRWQPRPFFNTVIRRVGALRRANHRSEEMRDEAPAYSRFAASFELVRYCPQCGAPVIPGAQFCTDCGETLAPFAPVAARRPTPAAGIQENQHVIAPFAFVFFAILPAAVAVAILIMPHLPA